jgi:hypothetical protein
VSAPWPRRKGETLYQSLSAVEGQPRSRPDSASTCLQRTKFLRTWAMQRSQNAGPKNRMADLIVLIKTVSGFLVAQLAKNQRARACYLDIYPLRFYKGFLTNFWTETTGNDVRYAVCRLFGTPGRPLCLGLSLGFFVRRTGSKNHWTYRLQCVYTYKHTYIYMCVCAFVYLFTYTYTDTKTGSYIYAIVIVIVIVWIIITYKKYIYM